MMVKLMHPYLRSLVLGTLVLLLWLYPGLTARATTQQELDSITQQWQTSAHGLNDINCARIRRPKSSWHSLTMRPVNPVMSRLWIPFC